MREGFVFLSSIWVFNQNMDIIWRYIELSMSGLPFTCFKFFNDEKNNLWIVLLYENMIFSTQILMGGENFQYKKGFASVSSPLTLKQNIWKQPEDSKCLELNYVCPQSPPYFKTLLFHKNIFWLKSSKISLSN